MELQVILNGDTIELDNGHQYMTILVDDAKDLIVALQDKVYTKNTERNLEKDYNYTGGL